jgi:hypothetical protein
MKARAANQPSRADDTRGDSQAWSGPSNLVGWCQLRAWADLDECSVDQAKVVLGLLE